ncbi:MAG: hypothetical protein LBV57_02090 [Candidatus Symbiothrix sp.]|jgi:hypothetical protein|nr:hypothetical protein [Candidatus Symbiothrix sp.]
MHTQDSDKPTGKELALLIFESAMALLYLFMAIVLFVPQRFHLQFNALMGNGIRIALGVIVGIYGVFRIYRAIKKM